MVDPDAGIKLHGKKSLLPDQSGGSRAGKFLETAFRRIPQPVLPNQKLLHHGYLLLRQAGFGQDAEVDPPGLRPDEDAERNPVLPVLMTDMVSQGTARVKGQHLFRSRGKKFHHRPVAPGPVAEDHDGLHMRAQFGDSNIKSKKHVLI